MDNCSLNLSVYCRKIFSCSETVQFSMLKCSGSTLGSMKLHGRWKIRCTVCIILYSVVK